MLLRTLIFFVYVVSTSLLQAQHDHLLRDPDIIWMAEYTTDFEMNPENEDELYPRRFNYLDVIQFQNSGIENGLYGRKVFVKKYLSQRFLQGASRPGNIMYRDSLVVVPFSKQELFSSLTKIDTAIGGCYNDTFIVPNDISFDEIWSFRIRQIFWYNQKNKVFESMVLAYAPVIDTQDDEGNYKNSRTLFWFKADENPPKRFKNKRFSYIFQTKMRDNAPRFEDFKVLKGNLDFKKIFAAELNKPSYACLDRYEYTPVTATALSSECFELDTIVTYDPATQEEQVQIEQRNCIEQIERIRFVQNWYYDERHNRLYARLMGVAPLAAIRDNEGEFRYYKPLFYQMYR